MEWYDKFRYSCACGWLDAAHIDFGVPKAMDALLTYVIDWSLFPSSTAQLRLRSIYLPFIKAFGVSLGNLNAVIDENHPDFQSRPLDIAVGIWMEAQETIERKQGNGVIGFVTDTSFSTEDLISNIVGYAASRAGASWTNSSSGELISSIAAQVGLNLADADYSQTWKDPWLQSTCRVLGKQESLDIFDIAEAKLEGLLIPPLMGGPIDPGPGTVGFPTNEDWQKPIFGYTGSGCSLMSEWSYEDSPMFNLVATAIGSSPIANSGPWWWENVHPFAPNVTRLPVANFDINAGGNPIIKQNLHVVSSKSEC